MTTVYYLVKLLTPCSPVESRTGHHSTIFILLNRRDTGRWDQPAGSTRDHVKIVLDSTVALAGCQNSARFLQINNLLFVIAVQSLHVC